MEIKRRWIQTFTGKRFYIPDPDPDSICLEDIAVALSRECRFGGHCREFYSVAQHSILVSQIVPPEDALWGLMHDVSEAFVKDLPSPIKKLCPDYSTLEKSLCASICAKFGLIGTMPKSIKIADEIVFATEVRDLMPIPSEYDCVDTLLPERIIPMSCEKAYKSFIARYEELTKF